jgi:hypothetical protein
LVWENESNFLNKYKEDRESSLQNSHAQRRAAKKFGVKAEIYTLQIVLDQTCIAEFGGKGERWLNTAYSK